jgi:hypothetical protein
LTDSIDLGLSGRHIGHCGDMRAELGPGIPKVTELV